VAEVGFDVGAGRGRGVHAGGGGGVAFGAASAEVVGAAADADAAAVDEAVDEAIAAGGVADAVPGGGGLATLAVPCVLATTCVSSWRR
jgi:hypothetical protein